MFPHHGWERHRSSPIRAQISGLPVTEPLVLRPGFLSYCCERVLLGAHGHWGEPLVVRPWHSFIRASMPVLMDSVAVLFRLLPFCHHSF